MINIKEAKRHEFFNQKAIPAARQNFYCTHSSKVSETYSAFFAICDEVREPLGFNYLCSATCGSDKLDICTNDAKLKNVQAFLSTEVEEKNSKTILQLLQEDDEDLRAEIEAYTDMYEAFRKAMLEIPKAPMPLVQLQLQMIVLCTATATTTPGMPLLLILLPIRQTTPA